MHYKLFINLKELIEQLFKYW